MARQARPKVKPAPEANPRARRSARDHVFQRGQVPIQKILDEHGQNHKWKDEQGEGKPPAFVAGELHLVAHEAAQALGKELAADDDVPAHGQHANENEHRAAEINAAPVQFRDFFADDLNGAQEQERHQRSQAGLANQQGVEQLAGGDRLEHFNSLLRDGKPVQPVQSFNGGVKHHGVEKEADHQVQAAHVRRDPPRPAQEHIDENAQGHAGHHGGKDEDNRHERIAPPGIGLDRAENETDITMQEKGRWNADDGNDPAHAGIEPEGRLRQVGHAQGEGAINDAAQAGGGLAPIRQSRGGSRTKVRAGGRP